MAPALDLLAQQMSDQALFVLCYIAEAHATDEWPIRSGRCNRGRGAVNVAQPKTDLQRVTLARRFRDDFELCHLNILVDSPEGGEPFERVFAPWPIRFYIIAPDAAAEDGDELFLRYKANPSKGVFDISHVKDFLELNFNTNTGT